MADIYGCSARILVNGRKIREYERDEDRAIFIESRINSEYEVELKNHIGQKVLAVVSVDGLDVISGQVATSDSPGYIIKPQSSIRIKGFRKDDSTVGSFKFVSKNKSYSNSQGHGGNEGVISVRFFYEESPTKTLLFGNYTTPEYGSTTDYNKFGWSTISSTSGTDLNTTAFNCCARSVTNESNNTFDTGTTWGSKKVDKITKKDFKRGSLIGEINFYYTTKEKLQSLGIFVKEETGVHYPKGFSTYATPPKGWE